MASGCSSNRLLVRGALVTSLLISGAAPAASTPAAAPPNVSKVHVRLLKSVGARTTWLLTATAADRDGDLVGGLVKIKVGAKGKVLSRRIVAPRGLAGAAAGGTGITSATLAGKALRVVFVVNAAPGVLPLRFSVADAHGHATKQVALLVRVSAAKTVTIAATTPNASEPSRQGTFTITRSGSTAAPLTVFYTVAGTATAKSDYKALPDSVTVRAGASSAAITVDPIDDETVEPSESVIVTLAARPGYVVGSPSSATVRIADDDAASSGTTVIVVATDPSAAEPSDPATLTVTRSGGSTASSLVVSYRVSGTATPGSDYTTLPGTVTIPAGAFSATITVNPIADSLAESTETVIVTLLSSSNYTIGTSSTAIVTIVNASAPTVRVFATDSGAGEPNNTGTFTVTRTGSAASSLVVSYTVSGTATAGTDYSSIGTSVTIPAGSASATITVTPIDDALAELSETVVLFLTFGSGYTVGSPSSATITISDNDGGATVTIAATDAAAAELAADPGTFTVTRSVSTASALVVSYTVAVTSTAAAGTDYTTLPGTVTIPAAATSAPITVTPIDDSLVEGDETVVVTLAAGSGYTVGTPSSATVTIADDDAPTVTIAATDAAAAELAADPGTFTVTRTGGTASSLVVSYTVAGTATAGNDYTTLTGTVTIPVSASSATIVVTPIDDSAVEGAETVVVTLISGTGYSVGSPNNATVTIADDDAPAVTIAATDDAAAEPSDPGTFTVTRTGSTTSSLDVSYTVAGTATGGTDYTSLSGTVTIPVSANSATITVTPIDDSAVEGAETVVVTLVSGSGYSVGTPDSATVTIADDDAAASVTIVATDTHAGEPNDPGTFTVTRTGSTAASLTVFYTVSGTAINGSDYTALPGSVVIPAGETSATITVGVIDDTLVEGAETVIVTLIATSGYSVGTPASASITINDND